MTFDNNEKFQIFYSPDLEGGGMVADDSSDLGFDGPPQDNSDDLLDGPGELSAGEFSDHFDFEPGVGEAGSDEKTDDPRSDADDFLPDEDHEIEDIVYDDEPDSVVDTGDEQRAANIEDEASIEQDGEGVPIELVLRAGQLGVSEDDVNFYSDKGSDALERFLTTVERMNGPKDEDSEEVSSGDSTVTIGDFDVQEFELSFGEVEDEYDDLLVEQLKSMSSHYNGELQRVMGTIKGLGMELLDRMNEGLGVEVNAIIDQRTSEKSVDYKKVFGAGNLDSATSEQLEMRDKVMDTVAELQEQRRQSGKTQLPIARYFDQAVYQIFSDDAANQKQKSEKLTNRRKATVARSRGKVNKSSKPRYGRQAALEAIRNQYGDEFID